ncbi:hypothetical protein [Actinoplanes sp. NPDC026670]|uniref:hypothetical protein n=1 Tax=Actinoplanes sp. NPDC026670 TaxID=3154700 RepID=UPI003406F341
MSNLRRVLAALGAAVLSTAALSTITAAPASAIPRTNYCGSAYAFLKSWPILWRNQSGGYIDVYYNSSNGYNCAIARGNDNVLSSVWELQVGIRRSGGTWVMDGDKAGQNFTRYAGPVYVSAPNTCIDLYGSFEASGGGSGQIIESVHCG